MHPTKSFLFLFFSLTLLILPAGATQLTINDLNMLDREVSIYQVNSTTTTLLFRGSSTNTTCELDPALSYHVVIEPSRTSWFDDPKLLLQYFINDALGQTITFAVCIIAFGGLIRLAFR